MKTLRTIYSIFIFAAASVVVTAQDYPDEYLGLPGDNLNLYAVMNLFQQSETLEGFERSLNDSENMINNLDLNGDNLIDYITVSDYEEGNVHSIVLRAALNSNEQQDVAVFVVEKLRNGEVQIQLIGDEALYGPNYIVEPIYAETPNPGYTGNVYRRNVVTTTYYDIAAWPLIRFIYYPGYVAWRSSWYWGYYPSYWRPWRPHYWHYYYGYHYHWHDYYYAHYHHWNHYRSRYYTTYYRPRVRVYSPTVAVNINSGRYRNTYSRPDQRRAGEDYYTRTASSRSRPGVSTSVGNRPAVRPTTTARTNSRNNTPAVQRSNSSNSRGNTVQRSQSSNGRSNTPAVQRSNNAGSRKSSATVSRSNSSRSTPSVQRSSSSGSRKSSSSVSRSSSSRSKPSAKHSSSSSNRSSNNRSSSSSRR